MKENEQFDLFKEPAKTPESDLADTSLKTSRAEESMKNPTMEKGELYIPTNEDLEFALGEDGKLLNTAEQARKNKEEFEKAKKDLKNIFEEPGSQPDLL